MSPQPDANTKPVRTGMANDNNRDQDLFTPARPRRVPRPNAWWVIAAVAVGGLLLAVAAGIWFPGTVASVLLGTTASVLAQSYFTWRSLYHYGAAGAAGLFVVGTAQGLFGKWIIVAFGPIALWAVFPSLNVIAMLLTVCVLNTLAAASTPVLVK